MFEPDTILEPMIAELTDAIAKMRRAKSLDDRVKWSQVVHNLTASVCRFLDVVNDFMDMADLDDVDFEDGLQADE